jgi:hypothetical protein
MIFTKMSFVVLSGLAWPVIAHYLEETKRSPTTKWRDTVEEQSLIQLGGFDTPATYPDIIDGYG